MHRTHFGRSLALAAALGLALPVLAAENAVLPTLQDVAGRVMVQRGDDYVPVTASFEELQPTDRVVVLEDGSVNLSCGGVVVTSFTEAGVYSVPQCPAQVAAAPVQPAGTSGAAATPAAGSAAGGYEALMNAGAITAVAAFGIAIVNDGDAERPVSP
jgi:hypothetical protein